MYQVKISNEEINQLDLIQFEGETAVISKPEKVSACFIEIMKAKSVGIDTETRPNFKKGVIHPIALLQIAIPDKVFIFRLLATGITNAMVRFFESDIKKIGIALHDDIKALQRKRKFLPQGFISLGSITTSLGIENQGLRKLTAIILGGRISKGQQLSNWENEILTSAQIRYAATDAWTCWKMYNTLDKQGHI